MTYRQSVINDNSHAIVATCFRIVLVVGADDEARTAFAKLFEAEGFRTLQASNVEAAEEIMSAVAVDLVIFDERLLGGQAYRFCRRVAVEGGAPIILLSDSADIISRIVALEVGADDLLSTPVDNRLLLAQARALMRRRDTRLDHTAQATIDAWRLDPHSREVTGPNGRRLRISPQEVTLLNMFLENPGVIFKAESAAHWIPTLKTYNTTGFRTAMSRLRRKLGELNCGEVIHTVHGAGYMYRPSWDEIASHAA